MLDSQFRGMKQALEGADPQAMQRVKDMMRSLNDMLDADARGEDTTQAFEQFMQEYGDFFPDNPQNLEELVDSLARRAAAAQRLMNSLSPEQQAELAELMMQAMSDAGLADEMGRLSDQLRDPMAHRCATALRSTARDRAVFRPRAPSRSHRVKRRASHGSARVAAYRRFPRRCSEMHPRGRSARARDRRRLRRSSASRETAAAAAHTRP